MKQLIGFLAGVALLAACGQTPSAGVPGSDSTAVTAGSEARDGLEPQALASLCLISPLDNTFGGCGKKFTGIGPNGNPNVRHADTTALAIQPDGKLLVAGLMYASNARGLIIRLNTNGSVDSSFANTGFQRINPEENRLPIIKKIIVQPDGKILVSGQDLSIGILQRLNADGSYDTGFSSPFNGQLGGSGQTMALQPDGKIVLNEYPDDSVVGGDDQMHLFRYNPDGSRDLSFSSAATQVPRNSSYNASVHVAPSGRIIVTGRFDSEVRAMAFTSTGVVDPSFATAGTKVVIPARYKFFVDPLTGRPRVQTTPCGITNSIQQADGKILVSGACGNPADNKTFIMGRINADGSSDLSFGTSGVKYEPSLPEMRALAVQPNGNIVVGGTENNDFLLARFNSTGVRDTVWGGSGKVSTGFSTRAGIIPVDSIGALVTSSDGKIIAAGASRIIGPVDPVGFAIARYKP